MAKWDVHFSHKASSRIVKQTVDAESKMQAVITALAEFGEPHKWWPVAAAEVTEEYYEKIARWADERDADIEEREIDDERGREALATFNED